MDRMNTGPLLVSPLNTAEGGSFFYGHTQLHHHRTGATMPVTYEDVYLWMIEQGATKQREIYETEDFDEGTRITDDYADTFGVDNQQLTQFLVDYTINGSIMRVC